MDLNKKNYRLDKTLSYEQLYAIFDNGCGKYGEGLQLQYKLLRQLSSHGTYICHSVDDGLLSACFGYPDKTISRIYIASNGNYWFEKVPTLKLYDNEQYKNKLHLYTATGNKSGKNRTQSVECERPSNSPEFDFGIQKT